MISDFTSSGCIGACESKNILIAKEIHEKINLERKTNGLPELQWNESLSNIATNYSEDMVKRNYFSHYDPEGRDFSYRYGQADFDCSIPGGNDYYLTGGENLFYFEGSYLDIAESAVQGWMNSKGHKENILNPYWKSEGIGVAGFGSTYYITQNFC